MDLKIVVQGADIAERHIMEAAHDAADIRIPLAEIYLTILDIIDEMFDREGERQGHPRWTADKIAQVVYKAKHDPPLNPHILQATSALKIAMTTYRHPMQFVRIEKTKIVISSKMLRGKVHQVGSPSAHIPARPYIMVSESDSNMMAREILRHVTRAFSK